MAEGTFCVGGIEKRTSSLSFSLLTAYSFIEADGDVCSITQGPGNGGLLLANSHLFVSGWDVGGQELGMDERTPDWNTK